jgi:hypothetical protein
MTRAERARMFRNRAYNLRYKWHRVNYSAWEAHEAMKDAIRWRPHYRLWGRV